MWYACVRSRIVFDAQITHIKPQNMRVRVRKGSYEGKDIDLKVIMNYEYKNNNYIIIIT